MTIQFKGHENPISQPHYPQQIGQLQVNGLNYTVTRLKVSGGYFNGVGLKYVGAAIFHFFKNIFRGRWSNLIIPGASFFKVLNWDRHHRDGCWSDEAKQRVMTFRQDEGGFLRALSYTKSKGILDRLQSQLNSFKLSNADMFEIPLDTLASLHERHIASLVIDKSKKKIYILDSKGYKPKDLHFSQPLKPVSLESTIQDLIHDLIELDPALFTEDWTIESTDWIQKPRDCAFTLESLMRGLAEKSSQERNLDVVQQEIYQHYSQKVDRLREAFLMAPESQKTNVQQQ